MDTAVQAVPLHLEPTAANYLECPIPETSLRIRIDLSVVERLAADAMDGFKKVPKRGLEVGGLLLGRVEKSGVVVDDFEAVDSEHQRGPSYLLSEKDRQHLAGAVARRNAEGARVVGLYRSHTRAGAPPGEEDIALMSAHCADSSAVLFLVKPRAGQPCDGMLFTAADGLRKPVEFPCHRGALRAGGYAIVEAPVQPPQEEPAQLPSSGRERPRRLTTTRVIQAMALQMEKSQQNLPQTVLIPPRRGRKRLRFVWAAAAVLAGGLAGYGYTRWRTQPAPPAAPPTRTLALGVAWAGGALQLRWDRDAPPIRKAGRGALWIVDGGVERRLDLTPQELTEGSIAYWPSSSDVNFKLEVFSAAGRASESVRAVSVPRTEAAQPKTPVPQSPSRQKRPPEPAGAEDRPFSRVGMEVIPQSALDRLAGKAPVTDPPRPLHTMLPPVPPSLRRRFKDEVSVDVKVDLDTSGKIKRVELASKRTEANRELSDLALYASRRWTFSPARTGERRVSSAVILHYYFGDPVLAEAQKTR